MLALIVSGVRMATPGMSMLAKIFEKLPVAFLETVIWSKAEVGEYAFSGLHRACRQEYNRERL